MIFIDTHVAIWLYNGEGQKFSRAAHQKLNGQEKHISPVVVLEVKYLFEVQKIKANQLAIVEVLAKDFGIKMYESLFSKVVEKALDIDWTRDVFDRLIVAEAMLHDAPLITKDKTIRMHYKQAVW